MNFSLYLDEYEGISRAITLCDGKVLDCYFDKSANPQTAGAVYGGVVDRILPNGKGAFVKIDNDLSGFLNDADGLSSGQFVLTQAKGEAREGKGPALNRNISLPGVYVIHQPLQNNVSYSRRLSDAQQDKMHERLAPVFANAPGGWVLRSAALHASAEDVASEIAEIVAFTRTLMSTPQQGLLVPALSVFEQALLPVAEVKNLQIIVQEGLNLEKQTQYLSKLRPTLLKNMATTYVKNAFEQHDLNGFYEQLKSPELALAGGGSLIIEKTRALTTIDVNGGTRTNYFDVNRDAAAEILNQIRWRNLGGMIVIDFLKMKRQEDRYAINDYLRDETVNDALPLDVFGFTRMGLCEISRARRGFCLLDAE